MKQGGGNQSRLPGFFLVCLLGCPTGEMLAAFQALDPVSQGLGSGTLRKPALRPRLRICPWCCCWQMRIPKDPSVLPSTLSESAQTRSVILGQNRWVQWAASNELCCLCLSFCFSGWVLTPRCKGQVNSSLTWCLDSSTIIWEWHLLGRLLSESEELIDIDLWAQCLEQNRGLNKENTVLSSAHKLFWELNEVTGENAFWKKYHTPHMVYFYQEENSFHS